MVLDGIRTKIRALITDLARSDFQVFSYTNSSIFTLAESNISSITKVLKNGADLIESGGWSYDSTTNKITILTSLIDNDKIEVDYTYVKYSDTELDEFLRASLVWVSVFAYSQMDYELDNGEIFPTPDQMTTDLFALISSILILPEYTVYRLPNVTVEYEGRLPKDIKIEKLISRFKMGIGVSGVITL